MIFQRKPKSKVSRKYNACNSAYFAVANNFDFFFFLAVLLTSYSLFLCRAVFRLKPILGICTSLTTQQWVNFKISSKVKIARLARR